MTNTLLKLKISERLNKLSSRDFDNIEDWQIIEAFNKAQIEWVRRQLIGNNIRKEGEEQTKIKIDDLQILIKNAPLICSKQESYEYQSLPLPEDYLHISRLRLFGRSEYSPARPFVVYLVEEGEVDLLLRDPHTRPSFDWAETFYTIGNNNIKIYTDGEFVVDKVNLIYYRFPKSIEIKGAMNPNTRKHYINDVECEFKDDIAELIIDEAVAILAGDTEQTLQLQRSLQNAERNT